MSQSRICCRAMLGIRALEIQQPCMSFRRQRSNISTSVPSRQTNLVRADEKKSLAWVQLHDRSPASYGIENLDGYLELIPPKTPLPCKKSDLMESAMDYIRLASFGIRCRRTLFDAPIEIAEDVVLDNIRLAKKGQAKFKVTMEMDKDLTGSVTVQDVWIRSKKTVDFDSGRLFQEWNSDHSLINNQH